MRALTTKAFPPVLGSSPVAALGMVGSSSGLTALSMRFYHNNASRPRPSREEDHTPRHKGGSSRGGRGSGREQWKNIRGDNNDKRDRRNHRGESGFRDNDRRKEDFTSVDGRHSDRRGGRSLSSSVSRREGFVDRGGDHRVGDEGGNWRDKRAAHPGGYTRSGGDVDVRIRNSNTTTPQPMNANDRTRQTSMTTRVEEEHDNDGQGLVADGESSSQRFPRTVAGMGWSFDNVDANGKTEMDKVYDAEYARITEVLNSVVESLAASGGGGRLNDGTMAPDFAIGLQYYNHGMRSTYQSAIAKRLGLRASQVKLSTAWNARYDASQFPKNVQMVLGVTLVEATGSGNTSSSSSAAPPRRLLTPPQYAQQARKNTAASASSSSSSTGPLFTEGSAEGDELRASIDALVEDIGGLVLPEMVAAQIVKATTRIAEVDYEKSRSEGENEAETTVWGKFKVPRDLFVEVKIVLQELTKIYSAVIVHELSPASAAARGVSSSSYSKQQVFSLLDKDRDLVMPVGAGTPVSFVQDVLPRWEKMFASTEIVPLVLNSWELVPALEDAGMNIPPHVAGLYNKMIGNTLAGVAPDVDSEGLSPEKAARTLAAAVAAATYDIVSRMASVARVEEMGTMSLSSNGSATNRFGTPRVLPAVFVHGVFLGGIAEMAYLRSNHQAFRALAANPQDIRMASDKIQIDIATNRTAVQEQYEGTMHDPRMQ